MAAPFGELSRARRGRGQRDRGRRVAAGSVYPVPRLTALSDRELHPAVAHPAMEVILDGVLLARTGLWLVRLRPEILRGLRVTAQLERDEVVLLVARGDS